MSKLFKTVAAVAASLTMFSAAQAAPVLLDFDSAATGANLGTSALVVSAGTITLSPIGAGSATVATNGHPTNGILHVQSADTDRALLSFSFDVSSITFDFAGEGTGNFIAEALDINGAVLATYTFTGTSCASNCFDATGVVLAGTGIRGFRFGDSPNGGIVSFVDNLSFVASNTVPEPGTLAGAGIALLGLACARRKVNQRR